MSIPRYSAYKSDGLAGLSEVPATWVVRPLKRVTSRIESGTSVNSVDVPAEEGQFGVLKTSCVYRGYFEASENKRVLEEEYGRLSCPVKAGHLIVSRMNTPQLVGAAGLVGAPTTNLFLPDRLWQIAFDGVESRFAYWWTQSAMYRDQVQAAATGTSASMKNIAQDQFLTLLLPLPSREEQKAIIRFLDRETAKIDALVVEQRRLMDILQEKRQAVISHAVTKGLNPDAPMKDSGVEWLGEVPAHWRVAPLRRLTRAIETGRTPEGGPDGAEDGVDDADESARLNWFTPADFGESLVLGRAKRTLSKSRIGEGSLPIFPANSVLLVGIGATLGKVAWTTGESSANQQINALLPNELTDGRFLALCLGSMREVLAAQASSATLPILNQEKTAAILVPVPPHTEQVEIAKELTMMLDRHQTALEQSSQSIAVLGERRAALITAAVTGQIDVRGLAAAEAA